MPNANFPDSLGGAAKQKHWARVSNKLQMATNKAGSLDANGKWKKNMSDARRKALFKEVARASKAKTTIEMGRTRIPVDSKGKHETDDWINP